MFARGMSARGLRAFLLLATVAGVIGTKNTLNAADITIQYTGQSNGQSIRHNSNTGLTTNTFSNNTAAQFNWNWKAQTTLVGAWKGGLHSNYGGTGPIFGAVNATTPSLATFCLEFDSATINTSNTIFTIQHNLVGLPQPGLASGQMNGTQAAAMQGMINGFFSGAIGGIGSIGAGNTYQALLQAAIWHIASDTDFNRTAGSFQVQDVPVSGTSDDQFNAALTALLNYASLNPIYNNASQQFFAVGLTRGANPEKQDQLMIMTREGFGGSGGVIAPVPTGVVMAGMGIICLGGFNFLRRRKTVAVA